MNKIWQADWLMQRNISPFVCFAHFQVYLQLGGSKHNKRACSEKHKRRFYLSLASEPNNQQFGWCSLPLWSAQSTSPNARCVPSEHVLISQNRSTFAFLFAFLTHVYRKRIWDEAVSLSLCFEHCYSRKQHISQALFRPSQALIVVTTRVVSLAAVFGIVTQRSSPFVGRSVAWRDKERLRGRLQHAKLTPSDRSPGFTSRTTLDPFLFGNFCGSVMGFWISIFRHFENS